MCHFGSFNGLNKSPARIPEINKGIISSFIGGQVSEIAGSRFALRSFSGNHF